MTTTITASPAGCSTALRRTGSVARWVLQLFLALQFAFSGVLKVTGDPQMVELFTDIGAGQWLRYLVGVCEIAAAIGLLIPRLAAASALGLSGLMAGAVVTNLLIGVNPAMPAGFLLVAVVIVYTRPAELRRLVSTRVVAFAALTHRQPAASHADDTTMALRSLAHAVDCSAVRAKTVAIFADQPPRPTR